MGALDLLVLINSQPSACQKEKKKQMGFKNHPKRLASSGEGFGARKNGGDLGHELI